MPAQSVPLTAIAAAEMVSADILGAMQGGEEIPADAYPFAAAAVGQARRFGTPKAIALIRFNCQFRKIKAKWIALISMKSYQNSIGLSTLTKLIRIHKSWFRSGCPATDGFRVAGGRPYPAERFVKVHRARC